MVGIFSKNLSYRGGDGSSGLLDSNDTESFSGVSEDSESVSPRSFSVLSLTSSAMDISKMELPSPALPLWPTSPTGSNVTSESSSSGNMNNEKWGHDLPEEAPNGANRKSLSGRYFLRFRSFCRFRSVKDQCTESHSLPILNPRLSMVGAIYKIDRCLDKIEKKANEKRMSRSSDAYKKISHLDRACRNCQQQYIVIRTLNNLLADLIKQKVASGCEMKVTDASIINGAYAIERILELNAKGKYLDDSPQGLYQMTRICEWTCAGIEDELRGIQLMIRDNGPLWKENRMLFIQKWGTEPHPVLSRIDFGYNHSTLFSHSRSIQEFLQGHVKSNPIGSVLPFWPTIQKQARDKEEFGHYVHGTGPVYCRNTLVLENIVKFPNRHPQQQQLIERCLHNIETVQSSIDILFDEIDLERKRRRACQHNPQCKHQDDTLVNLGKSLVKLNDMTIALNTVTRHVQSGLQRGLQDIDLTIVADWQSLEGNPYGCLMILTSDKIVERLIKTPLWEEKVTEADEILRRIRRTCCQSRRSEGRPARP